MTTISIPIEAFASFHHIKSYSFLMKDAGFYFFEEQKYYYYSTQLKINRNVLSVLNNAIRTYESHMKHFNTQKKQNAFEKQIKVFDFTETYAKKNGTPADQMQKHYNEALLFFKFSEIPERTSGLFINIETEHFRSICRLSEILTDINNNEKNNIAVGMDVYVKIDKKNSDNRKRLKNIR